MVANGEEGKGRLEEYRRKGRLLGGETRRGAK